MWKQNLSPPNIDDLDPCPSRPSWTEPRKPPPLAPSAWPGRLTAVSVRMDQALLCEQLTPKPPCAAETKTNFSSGCTSGGVGEGSSSFPCDFVSRIQAKGGPGPGICQARILKQFAISFSRGSSETQGYNPGLLQGRQILQRLSNVTCLISKTLNFVFPIITL